jgi:serine/threonine protein kinase/Tfp pilus assembly protein PilF
MIGKTISHYRIVEQLGAGGMGVVYLAEDTLLGRQVAIKTLTTSRDNTQFKARFLREARAVSALSHPHIAHIYDYGETDDGPYIVMEFIKGSTLSDLINAESLTIPRAIEIVKQVASALGEAHRKGIVHRDIKPSNIAINERGEVKVLDFGLAKQLEVDTSEPEANTLLQTQTRDGVIVGTPMYLSPEQALGVSVDARSDMFSLGSVFYECITGRPVFWATNAVEICAKVIRENPLPPSHLNRNVSRQIDRIVLKLLAKVPEARYQTADELIAALNSIVTDQSNGSDQTVTRQLLPASATESHSPFATLSDIFKRPRVSLGYILAGVIAVAGLTLFLFYWTRGSLPPPKPEAKQLYDRGLAALHAGSYFKASRFLQRALEVDNNYALAHARLAEAYGELDYTDKAQREILSASRLVGDRSLLDSESAFYLDAISATVLRDIPAAIKAYSEITKLKKNDAVAYTDLGRAYENHDEIDQAIAQYQKASELDRNNPAPFLRLGVLHGRRQDLKSATAAFDQAESLYRDDQNPEGISEVFYQRGYLSVQMGKIPEAQSAAEQAFNLSNTVSENKYQQVRAQLLLGVISYSSGNTDRAQTLTTQALETARANGMENLATRGLLDVGNTLALKRDFTNAELYARQALELARNYVEKRNEAYANLLLGSIFVQQGDVEKGAPFIDEALAFYRPRGYRRETSRCMVLIGRRQLLQGDFSSAMKTLDEQLELAKQVEDPGELARSQSEVAAALSKQDLYPQALTRYAESYELSKKLGNPLRVSFALLNKADMSWRLGKYDEAKAAITELDQYLNELSDDNRYKKIWKAWSHLYMAQMYLSQRNLNDARSQSSSALSAAAADDLETRIEINAVQCLTEVAAGAASKGRPLCEAAAKVDLEPASISHKGHVQLALAEARLEAGDAKGCADIIIQAQQISARLHEGEREWRAWLLAARANQRLGNLDAMRQQLSNAQSLLNALKEKWGSEAFSSYSSRPDIQAAQQQLQNMLTASGS